MSSQSGRGSCMTLPPRRAWPRSRPGSPIPGSPGGGATTAEPGKNITAYYRIQGPRLVIEYAPQRMGGDSSLYVHTIHRDPVHDYGRKTTAQ